MNRPPRWAVLQRQLIEALESAASVYLDKYTRPDGSLKFRDGFPPNPRHSRDAVDDFYESFYQLPLLYLIGGDDWLLDRSNVHWEGVTAQLTDIGMLNDEFDRGYDWFHIGEGQLFFYGLCLASPESSVMQARARRFADLYVRGTNYDPHRNMIRAPHTGSEGPRYDFYPPGPSVFAWQGPIGEYGLPLAGVPGVETFEALERYPSAARRMGEAMDVHFGRGDVAVNLSVTGLVANAFMLDGDPSLTEWILRYAEGWVERADQNDGLLPDNVGPGGMVGELFGGRWYGGLYGWSWPHGFQSVGCAAAIAGTLATTLTGDDRLLAPARSMLDRIVGLGRVSGGAPRDVAAAGEALPQANGGSAETFLVPQRFREGGWFDFRPLACAVPLALWVASLDPGDRTRLSLVSGGDGPPTRDVLEVRAKEDNGHEPQWFAFLEGSNPDFPESALTEALAVVELGVDGVLRDENDLNAIGVHHWQEHNPLTLEALMYLTLGGPPPLYNGGLLLTAVRHFDPVRRRPGLPTSVAALVTRVGVEGVSLELVNLDQRDRRPIVVQAGSLAQHSFTTCRLDGGEPAGIGSRWLQLGLAPSAMTHVDLGWSRHAFPPTYSSPPYDSLSAIEVPA